VLFRSLFFRRRMDEELEEELQFHIDMQAQKNQRTESNGVKAERKARLQFGSVVKATEECREARGISFIEIAARDLRFALRMLRKSPGFAAVAILTLALGIGATSAIFSVINSVLLRPLLFKNPDEIVSVWARFANDSGPVRGNVHSYPDFVDLRDQSQSIALGAYARAETLLSSGDGDVKDIFGVGITPEVFDVLGVSPFLGRAFTRDDVKNDRVVVLTYSLWKSAFASDPNIIGRQVMLSARTYTVIGVMPPGWKLPVEDEHIEYALPLEYLHAQELDNRGSHYLNVVGRLKPGVQLKTAEVELTAIASRLSKQYPETNRNFTSCAVVTLHSDVVGDVRPALIILFGAVALVLLIACANVANLLLARAASRSREIAIRTALGASRTMIVRQLLCESLLLGVLGGAAGLLLARWGVDLLGAAGAQGLPHLGPIKVDFPVCAFTFALATGCAIVFGLIPALQVSRPAVNQSLQQGAKGSGGLHANRLRAFLVVSQVSLSLLLLAGAGLLIKSFFNLRMIDPGFDSAELMTMPIDLLRVRYPEIDQQIRAWDEITQKLATTHGVESVGGASPLPLGPSSWTKAFMVSGAAPLPRGDHPRASYLLVEPDYFKTMKIPLSQGRAFTTADTKDSPQVVMINQAFARRFFPDRNPIGQQVMVDQNENNVEVAAREIVGIAGDTRHDTLALPPTPEIYVPLSQHPSRSLDIVLRVTSSNLPQLNVDVRRALHEIDKDLYVPPLEPMSSIVGKHLTKPRFNMLLLASFAGVATILAAIGIYGVIAYSVGQRTNEIGIRMALGAQKIDMLRMILRQNFGLIGIGLAAGVFGALSVTRFMSSLLYGVSATDLSTYASATLLLGSTALVATWFPARRAMSVNPMIALRSE